MASYMDVLHYDKSTNTESKVEVTLEKQLGFLVRTGFERNKLRVGLEYNFIPKTDITVPNSTTVGTVNSSFLGVTIGLMLRNI